MTTRILIGDCLEQLRGLPAESVHCAVTSPPYYGLRDYGVAEAIGLEATPEQHIAALVAVFREVRRVLRKDGVLWLNYGDAYATQPAGNKGHVPNKRWSPPGADGLVYGGNKPFSTVGQGAKAKDLLMLPSRVALALQADGWWLRSMLPWIKRSAMPESATDRPATAIEYVFMLTKSARYYFDMEAVRQAYQPDSVARVDRGRSNDHKWADGGPGNQTLARDISKACTSPTGRNFRNADIFYASLAPPHGLISAAEPLALDVNPAGFAEAHFATFPPKLVEPLIKAASSEKGVCGECGAPWVREVAPASGGAVGAAWLDHSSDAERGAAKTVSSDGYQAGKTLGWSPACACNAEPVPATILDPFGGAGTTALVADRLGRDCILIELNPEYAEMARKRISGDAPLFAEVTP